MSLFRKKEVRNPETERIFNAKQQFQNLQKTEHLFTDDLESADKVDMLAYLLDTVTRDLCTSIIAEPLYCGHGNPIFSAFPLEYPDENGDIHHVSVVQTTADLSECFVYVSPWNHNRMRDNLLALQKQPFVFDKNNHIALYYPEINLCHIVNGNHSINAGRYFKKGIVAVRSYNLSQLFPHIETDGAYWFHAYTGAIITAVSDFRLAGIYYLAKRRWSLS